MDGPHIYLAGGRESGREMERYMAQLPPGGGAGRAHTPGRELMLCHFIIRRCGRCGPAAVRRIPADLLSIFGHADGYTVLLDAGEGLYGIALGVGGDTVGGDAGVYESLGNGSGAAL